MKHIILILINIIFSLTIKAQLPQLPTNMQSPNAAGLGIYGQVPISLYTGIPEISIPLGNLPNKNIDLPIILSYYAGGVKVDQHPGWVGTNWTLMAGGSISRIVKGLPDETHEPGQWLDKAGYYYNRSALNVSNWNSVQFMNNIPFVYGLNGIEGTKDFEPDEFSFNFNGISGKFYISSENDANNLPKLVINCSKTVKITFNQVNQNVFLDFLPTEIPSAYNVYVYPAGSVFQNKPFSGFTITTEQGIKYVFGSDFSSIDFSTDFFNQSKWTASAWHLKKIIEPNGNETIFSYKRAKDSSGQFRYINQLYHYDISESSSLYVEGSSCYNRFIDCGSNPLRVVEALWLSVGDFFTWVYGNCQYSQGCSSYSYPSIGSSFGGSLIFPAYLESITAPDYKVKFITSQSVELRTDPDGAGSYNPYADPLSSYYNLNSPNRNPYLKYWNIKNYAPYLSSEYLYQQHLLQLQWQKLDTIKILNYSNNLIKSITFNYNNSVKERLFLLSLTENMNDKQSIKKYSFDYNQKELLPPYLSNQTDHWGFFNNKTPNNLNSIDYYSSREPDAITAKYGIIKKITYPTGGTTEFEFEINNYSKKLKPLRWQGYNELTSDITAGGLRIKKITNNSNNGSLPEIKEYFYVNNYSPTNSTGKSSGILGGDIQYFFYYLVQGSNNFKYIQNIFSSQSVLPMCNNSLGSHVGYSEVVEKLSDGSYTRYKFTNFDYTPRNSLDEKFENTADLTLTSYQPYNSNEQLRGLLYNKEIRDASNNIKYLEEYKYVNSDTTKNKPYVKAVKCKLRTTPCGWFFKESTSYKIYTYSMLLERIDKSTYDNIGYSTGESEVRMYNEQNQIIAEDHIGSLLYTSKITYYPQDIVNHVPIANWPNTLLSSMTVEASNMTNDFCLLPIAEETIINGAYPKSNYYEYFQPKTGCHVLKNVYTSSKANVFQKLVEFTTYDSKANPMAMTNKESLNTVYLWSYNGQYPVAEIRNANYSQVSAILTEQVISNLSTSIIPLDADLVRINSLRTLLPNAMVTTFDYYPLVGLKSKTEPNGISTTYNYDKFNRLMNIKDSNGKIIQSFEYNYKYK